MGPRNAIKRITYNSMRPPILGSGYSYTCSYVFCRLAGGGLVAGAFTRTLGLAFAFGSLAGFGISTALPVKRVRKAPSRVHAGKQALPASPNHWPRRPLDQLGSDSSEIRRPQSSNKRQAASGGLVPEQHQSSPLASGIKYIVRFRLTDDGLSCIVQ